MPSRPVLSFVAPEPDEHALQIACAAMFKIILLDKVHWTGVDHAHTVDKAKIGRNGRPMWFGEMAKRLQRGIKPGIPDFLFWHRGKSFAIELKVGDGDTSEEQDRFLEGLIHAHAQVKVCWNQDQVLTTVTGWGLVRPGVRFT